MYSDISDFCLVSYNCVTSKGYALLSETVGYEIVTCLYIS